MTQVSTPGGDQAGGWAAPDSSGYGQVPGSGYGQVPGSGYGQTPGGDYGQPPQPQTGWGGYAPAPIALRPGIIPLRPLSVGEVLDGSISLIRKNPRPTLAISAVAAVVISLVGFGLQQITTDPSTSSTEDFLLSVLQRIFGLVVTLVVAGFVTAVAGDAVLGRRATLEEIWPKVRPKLPAMIGAALLVGLITVVSVLGLVVAIVIPFTVYAFVTPIILLEHSQAMPSLKRSRALVKGAFWRTLGILVLATIIAAVLSAIFLVPFGVLVALSGGNFATTVTSSSTTTALLLLDVGAAVASTLTLPFVAGVHALLYVDQRMRTEGLDVALRQAASESVPDGR